MWVGQLPTGASTNPGYPARIFAYDMATKARKPAEDFNTLVAAGNDYPAGIWSDGTTMFVLDEIDRHMYAYDMATKERDTDKEEVYLNKLEGFLGGIWNDGTIMWITDISGGFNSAIRAYDHATGQRLIPRQVTGSRLHSNGNTLPWGVWADGTDIFVSNQSGHTVYAYWKDSGQINWGRNIALDPVEFSIKTDVTYGPNGASGIWSDGTTMWVVSVGSGRVLPYALPPEVERTVVEVTRKPVTVGPVTDTMALVEVDIARLVTAFGTVETAISVHLVDTFSSATMYVHPEGGIARFLLMGLRPETQYTLVVTYGVETKYHLGASGRRIFRTKHAQIGDIETPGLDHTEATVRVSLAGRDIDTKRAFKYYPHSNRDEAGPDYTFYLRHKASDETEWSEPVELTFSDFTADARLTGLEPGTAYDVEVAETEDFMPPTATVASYSGTLTVGENETGEFAGMDVSGHFFDDPFGSMAPDPTFSIAGYERSVIELYTHPYGGPEFDQPALYLNFDTQFGGAEEAGIEFTLTVDGTEYHSADASRDGISTGWDWLLPPSWSADDTVVVQMDFTATAESFREGSRLEVLEAFTTHHMPPTLAYEAEMTVGGGH